MVPLTAYESGISGGWFLVFAIFPVAVAFMFWVLQNERKAASEEAGDPGVRVPFRVDTAFHVGTLLLMFMMVIAAVLQFAHTFRSIDAHQETVAGIEEVYGIVLSSSLNDGSSSLPLLTANDEEEKVSPAFFYYNDVLREGALDVKGGHVSLLVKDATGELVKFKG